MTATRKITEAEQVLTKLQRSSGEDFQTEFSNFLRTIHEIFSHLLDEYNKKFDLRMERVGLEKFKAKAKKLKRVEIIDFLIWYEKEYRSIKNEKYGYLMEVDSSNFGSQNSGDIIEDCSALLNKAKMISYYAYENF